MTVLWYGIIGVKRKDGHMLLTKAAQHTRCISDIFPLFSLLSTGKEQTESSVTLWVETGRGFFCIFKACLLTEG